MEPTRSSPSFLTISGVTTDVSGLIPLPNSSSTSTSPIPFTPLAPSSSSNTNSFLKLSERFVKFDPQNKNTNVFFDDIRSQVFVVRDNGSGGVQVCSLIQSRNCHFYFEDKGPISSIKFSPDQKILSVQRSNKSVEFLNMVEQGSLDLQEYSQVCRARSAKILGFYWISSSEIVLITDTHGLESYAVRADRKSLKSLKNYSLPVCWAIFTPPFLLLASGPNGTVLHLFDLRAGGNYHRYPKFEVDLKSNPGGAQAQRSQQLLHTDVALAPVYGVIYVLVIKQFSKLNAGAEVVLYQVSKDTVRVSDVLLLECNGRFAMHTVDNLIVVHHQQSKMSKIFDLRLNTRPDSVKYHFPISSYSIEPYQVKLHNIFLPYELYSPNWAVFHPNIIVDTKLGCLWQLELKSDNLACLIPDKVKRVEFLLMREYQPNQQVLIKHLSQFIRNAADFVILPRIFELLQKKLKSFSTKTEGPGRTVFLDQIDVYRFLLLPLSESKDLDPRHIVAVVMEYLKSLIASAIEPQFYLQELVINILMEFDMFHLLRHLVENHVCLDSKPFACLILSLQAIFPPAFQMALDMLKRVGSSVEEQVEILLAKYQIFPALRLVLSSGQHESQLAPRKFLEPAMQSGNNILFYSVYRHFQQRNIRLRQNSKFLSEELCDDITCMFEQLFPESADPVRQLVF